MSRKNRTSKDQARWRRAILWLLTVVAIGAGIFGGNVANIARNIRTNISGIYAAAGKIYSKTSDRVYIQAIKERLLSYLDINSFDPGFDELKQAFNITEEQFEYIHEYLRENMNTSEIEQEIDEISLYILGDIYNDVNDPRKVADIVEKYGAAIFNMIVVNTAKKIIFPEKKDKNKE